MFTHLGGGSVGQVACEPRNVIQPIAERWDFDREDLQPIVEISTKTPLVDCTQEVAVRCSDYTDVYANRFGRAYWFELALLEDAKQLDLRLEA